MKIVGITGGIGAGKSFVCSIFKSMGIPVYDSDLRAKEIILANKQVKKAIIQKFGKESFFQDGSYNTKYISQIIFNDIKARQALNNIVHPAVKEDTLQWIKQQKHKNPTYIIKESALLFESGLAKECDFIVLVDAPIRLRAERIKDRNHLSMADALRKIKSQGNQSYKKKLADFIIHNNQKKMLLPQIVYIHNQLLLT